MLDFHFIRPWFLLGLLPVLGMVFLLLRKQQDGAAWMKFMDPRLLKHLLVGEGKQAKIKPVQVLSIIWILSVIALAGPSWRKQPSPFSDDQAGLVLLLKLSGSMEATDVQPSRMERAKFKMRYLLEQRSGAASALIVYSGSAHLVMPLTKDDAIISSMAEGLTPEVMPSQGDDLAAAISTAASLLKDAGVPGSVLVIADSVDPSQAASLADVAPQLPVQFLAIQASGSAVDAGLESAAAARGAEVIRMTDDDSDVLRAQSLAESKMLHAASEDGSERWQDAGYWLLPVILLGAGFWCRKGWQI
ncbi:vWA domain-containing protein [Rubritalea sp.]|uniref:vWA domain-containing protein n=1 Tax=Rubritalea sp. TaxID=2109375 RepID=UPI003EF63A89